MKLAVQCDRNRPGSVGDMHTKTAGLRPLLKPRRCTAITAKDVKDE